MKKNLFHLCIVLLLSCTAANAQQEQSYMLDSTFIYHYTQAFGLSEPYRKISHTYDEDVKSIIHSEDWEATKSKKYYKRYYSNFFYNPDKKLRKIITYELVNDKFLISDENTYEYDAKGRLSRITNKLWDKDHNRLEINRDYTFEYDDTNKIKSILWKSGEKLNLFYDFYYYNTKGNITKILRKYHPDHYNGQLVKSKTFLYNENGQHHQMITQVYDGASWINHNKYAYSYDNHGNITGKTTYIYDTYSNRWELNFHYNYEYYENILAKNVYMHDDPPYLQLSTRGRSISL